MRALVALSTFAALSPPVRWAYRWHRRVTLAAAAAAMDDEPLTWRDVTPFSGKAGEIDRAISEINEEDLWGFSLPAGIIAPPNAYAGLTTSIVPIRPGVGYVRRAAVDDPLPPRKP